MEIGEIIRYYREKKGFTQKELGEKIHVSQRTIGHYETGERSPHVKVLESLAKALNIKTEDFFKPIKEEVVKYRYFDHAWLYHYDEKKGIHELLDDSHFNKKEYKRYMKTYVGNDIVYFFASDIEKVRKGDMNKTKETFEIEGENIPIVRLLDSTEKGYVIVNGKKEGKKIKTAIPVDEFSDTVYVLRTCKQENEATNERKRKDDELSLLSLSSLNLKIDAARLKNEDLNHYAHCVKDFVESVKNEYSSKILKAIIREIVHTSHSLPKEIKEEIIKLHNKDKEQFPEHFKEMKIIGYTIDEIEQIVLCYSDELG